MLGPGGFLSGSDGRSPIPVAYPEQPLARLDVAIQLLDVVYDRPIASNILYRVPLSEMDHRAAVFAPNRIDSSAKYVRTTSAAWSNVGE